MYIVGIFLISGDFWFIYVVRIFWYFGSRGFLVAGNFSAGIFWNRSRGNFPRSFLHTPVFLRMRFFDPIFNIAAGVCSSRGLSSSNLRIKYISKMLKSNIRAFKGKISYNKCDCICYWIKFKTHQDQFLKCLFFLNG